MLRPRRLDTIFDEESTGVIKTTFRDESNNLTTPTSIRFHITDVSGQVVVYDREVTPTNPAYIELSGPDLQLFANEKSFGERILTLFCVYNSDISSDAPMNESVRFKIRNLRLVAYPIDLSVLDHVWSIDTVDVNV